MHTEDVETHSDNETEKSSHTEPSNPHQAYLEQAFGELTDEDAENLGPLVNGSLSSEEIKTIGTACFNLLMAYRMEYMEASKEEWVEGALNTLRVIFKALINNDGMAQMITMLAALKGVKDK